MAEKLFKKFAQGLLIVKASNSSFNSDFSGLPRRLPDNNGTIYATDKALKYCIRNYLNHQGETVFVWRRYKKEDLSPCSLEQNYKEVFGSEHSDAKKETIKQLLSALDVRLFGATFSVKNSNISLTGTTQISYGINKFDDNLFFNSQILSPYANSAKPDSKQQTLGNETKTMEAHYTYDFVINPNNLSGVLPPGDSNTSNLLLQESDVELFKKAMCHGVSNTLSASKIGSDSELLLFVEMNSTENNGLVESHILPMMKDHVKISKNENKTVIDLKELFDAFDKNYTKLISSVEIYYDDDNTELVGIDKFPIKKRHIVTLDEIKSK